MAKLLWRAVTEFLISNNEVLNFQLRRGRILKDLNLIPKNYFIEKKNKRKKAYLSILILCVGFIIVAVYLIPTVYENNLENEKSSLEQKITQTKDYIVSANEINSLKQAIEAREKEGTLLSQKKLDMLEIVNVIEGASPDKLFIQKFDATGEDESDIKISLAGVAENEETIASFLSNLKDDGYFREVGIGSVLNKQGNNGASFTIALEGVIRYGLTKYNGWDNNFSIKYIPSWSISEEKNNKVVFQSDPAFSVAKPATLEVKTEETALNVEEFSKKRQSTLEETLEGYELVYSNKTKNSKSDAMKTMYYATEDNLRYQFLELCVIKDYKCYIVTYKSDSTSFSNMARIIDRVLKSFTIN